MGEGGGCVSPEETRSLVLEEALKHLACGPPLPQNNATVVLIHAKT